MLGAPLSRSAHARLGPGGSRRLHPRPPHAWSLFRLVSDHTRGLQTIYDKCFARDDGPWRPVVAQVADQFLACGVLEHGFARMRCNACARVSAGVLVQVSLLPSCPAQAPGHLNAIGRSGRTPRSSRPCRTGTWCSPFRSGCAPIACIVAACSVRLPASPPTPPRQPSVRRRASARTGIRFSICSSPTAGSGLTRRSSRGRPITPRG